MSGVSEDLSTRLDDDMLSVEKLPENLQNDGESGNANRLNTKVLTMLVGSSRCLCIARCDTECSRCTGDDGVG